MSKELTLGWDAIYKLSLIVLLLSSPPLYSPSLPLSDFSVDMEKNHDYTKG